MALLEDTLPAQIDPEGSLRLLQEAVATARVLKGVRGDADETARQLLSVLDGASASFGFDPRGSLRSSRGLELIPG